MTTEENLNNYPLEYQIFALCLRKDGAIKFFSDNLNSNIVGINHGENGIYEFYNALMSYYKATQLSIVDPIAFKSWLQTETEIYDALGGEPGTEAMFSILMKMDLSNSESILKLIEHKANKRKQIDYLQELQVLITQKSNKSDEDIERISVLTQKIRELESQINYDPLENVTTAIDISSRAEELLVIPNFLPTQFKSLNRAMGYTDNGGFFKGAVHAIIAPSGKGKSTFAKCLVNNWVDNGYSALFVNFEEAISHWERVLMTQIIGKNIYSEANKWSPEEKEKYHTIFIKEM